MVVLLKKRLDKGGDPPWTDKGKEQTMPWSEDAGVVSCKICGDETPMTVTKHCDRCWELMGRMERDPEIVAKIMTYDHDLWRRIISHLDASQMDEPDDIQREPFPDTRKIPGVDPSELDGENIVSDGPPYPEEVDYDL